MLKNKKVVFFDLFSTLVSLNDHNSGLEKASQHLGIDEREWSRVSMSQYHERGLGLIKRPFDIVSHIAREIRPDLSDKAIEEAVAIRIRRFHHCVTRPQEEVIDVLIALKKAGYRLGLISNADVIDIMGWSESPLSDLFESVIFSCEVGLVKPDKAIYEMAIREMNIGPEACIFVGDGGSAELTGARSIGMSTVLTTQYRWQNDQAISELKKDADYSIKHLYELREMLV